MIPDDQMRQLLREQDRKVLRPDPAFLGSLYLVLDDERRKSRSRASWFGRLVAVAPVAAAAAIVVAVGATGLLLTGRQTQDGGGLATPAVSPPPVSAPPSPTSSTTPSPAPSASPAPACALHWDTPPAKDDRDHALTGTGFAPSHEVTMTFKPANGDDVTYPGHSSDEHGRVDLDGWSWTNPLANRDQGEYVWIVIDGTCTATYRVTIR